MQYFHGDTEEISSKRSFTKRWACRPMFAPNFTERLIASLGEDISPETANAQLAEVRRRISPAKSGEAALTPGDEALVRVRNLLAEHLYSN